MGQTVDPGKAALELYIPLEDIRDGWRQSGQEL
jgi:hypothetical protein